MRLVLFVLVVTSIAIGGMSCQPKQEQAAAEYRIAGGLIQLLRYFEAEHPGAKLTNVVQLYQNVDVAYPHQEDRLFRSYGRHAGFTNSFYEKYVFLPAERRPQNVQGEIFLLNARPFPDRNGNLGRMVFSKAEPNIEGYRIKWMDEKQVERMFQTAGLEIPKPVPMPPPPSAPPDEAPMPLSTKVSRFFMRVADYLGISQHWLLLRNATIVGGMVGLVLLGAYLWLSRTRRR